jgi:predicted permease
MTWWGRLIGRGRVEAQLDDELRDHVERQVADYVRTGMSEPEARRRTRVEFGGLDQVKEQCRDVRGTRLIEDLLQDLRYASRVLGKSPGFTIAAVASLALGIGANTAIFSLIDAVMLKSLPVQEPERLIEPVTDRGSGQPFNAFSYPALVHFRDHATTLEGMIASHSSRLFIVIGSAAPELGEGQYVTGNFFPVLGVPALLGRTVQPADDRPEAAPVAVLSHAYWQRRFGGDPYILGRRLTLDGHVFTIVGVAPPRFRGMTVGRNVDVWIPLAVERRLRTPSWTSSAGYKWLQLVGRVKAGSTYEQARVELQTMFRTGVIEAELALLKSPEPDHPATRWRLLVEPARAGLSAGRRQFSEPLVVLLAVSGLVLAIACLNVANLLLARAAARRQEMAVRLSLGAARSRVMRQLLTESLLLASAGAALGIALAYAGCQYLLAFFATSRAPVRLEIGPDIRVLVFTAALALATGLLFGLAPAWRTTRQAQSAWLVGAVRVHGSRDRRMMSRMLIGAQVALSTIMLVGAGLFLRSLHNVRSIETGFDRDGVLIVTTDASRSGLTASAQRAAFRELIARLAAIPGVVEASLSWVTPIEGGGSMRTLHVRDDDGAVREARNVHLNWVSPGYFSTMRTPIQAGRDFTWQDTVTSPKTALVNQTMARRYFGNEQAVGRRVTLDTATYEIVGVVGDAKYLELRDTVPPTLYFSAFQQEHASGQFVIRTEGRPLAIESSAREIVHAAAPSIAVTKVRSLAEQVDASIVRERMLGVLSGFFAGLGLLLAAVGLYGVLAYMVARRTSEIGIRMALGAKPSLIARMVLREALTLTAGGIVAGTVVALLLSRSLSGLLFGLTPTDPLTIASVAVVLVATALAAAYLPSRRAARLDPTVALRHE